jgi:hypothetical protein
MRIPLSAFLASVVCLAIAANANAQTINLLNSRVSTNVSPDEAVETDPPSQWAIPAGASAGVDSTDSGTGLGPVLGFQRWTKDRSFLSVLFSFAPESEITGSEREFGSFLLSPPFAGTSLTGAFNKLTDNKKWPFLLGVSGRLGVTRTKWSGNMSPSTPNGAPVPTTIPGDVLHTGIGALLMTKTLKAEGGNEYQLGLEASYVLRNIIGDLGSSEKSEFRKAVIGTDQTKFNGPEVTLFARLNSAQPFVRISRVGGYEVDGLNGWQTFFGVTVLSAIFQGSFEEIEVVADGLGAVTQGTAVNYQFGVKGGKPSYTFSLVQGILPNGLVLDGSGLLHGTPQLAQEFAFWVQVKDSQGLKSKPKRVVIIVAPAPKPPSQ